MIEATKASASPIPVNTLGDNPVAAKVLPIFCNAGFNESRKSVSYTHLTLPTIYSV